GRFAVRELEIHHAEVTPIEIRAAALLQVSPLLLQRSAERTIERVADDGRLPGETRLTGVGGLSECEPRVDEAREKCADVRRAREIRFVNAAHRRGGALGEKRTDPLARGRTKRR